MPDAQREVVITGLGPVTALAVGVEPLWEALRTGRSRVETRTLQVDRDQTVELPMASLLDATNIPGLAAHADTLASQRCASCRDLGYALLAAKLALADAGLDYNRADNHVGVVQAFEAPGMERAVAALFELLATPPPTNAPPPGVYDLLAPHFYTMQPFLYLHLMGRALGLHGYSTSVHNACTSGLYALELAAQRIRSGEADVMLVASGEAFETAVRLEWFRRLDLYCSTGRMAPFAPEPGGFFVGEGGAALVLEAADHAETRGAPPYARYLGAAFAQQSAQQTVPDSRANRLAGVISAALTGAQLSPGDVGLVVPHGAATTLNDAYESHCLELALGPAAAADARATTFKPYVGHHLAGSGVIDTLCALLAMKHGLIPPSLNLSPQSGQCVVPLVTDPTASEAQVLLKLSTGFTGHDAAALFARA